MVQPVAEDTVKFVFGLSTFVGAGAGFLRVALGHDLATSAVVGFRRFVRLLAIGAGLFGTLLVPAFIEDVDILRFVCWCLACIGAAIMGYATVTWVITTVRSIPRRRR